MLTAEEKQFGQILCMQQVLGFDFLTKKKNLKELQILYMINGHPCFSWCIRYLPPPVTKFRLFTGL